MHARVGQITNKIVLGKYAHPTSCLTFPIFPGGTRAQVGAKPNVVLILLDDAGYADLRANYDTPSVHSPLSDETPRLDQMSRESLRLTNFHVSATTCTPSRAALLTGRRHRRMNIDVVFKLDTRRGLPPADLTMPELLKDAGYRTAMAGKWHLGWTKPFHPAYQGFDRVLGLPASHDVGCTDPWRSCIYNESNSPRLVANACKLRTGIAQELSLRNTCPQKPGEKKKWAMKSDLQVDAMGHITPPVSLFDSLANCSSKGEQGEVDTNLCRGDIIEQVTPSFGWFHPR